MWVFYALLSAAFASLVAIFGKIGIKHFDSTAATTVRAGVMFVLMLLVTLTLKKFPDISALHGRIIFWIILSGIAGGLSWLFYFLALKNGPTVGTAALDRLSVVFTVILAALFLGEKLTLLHALGALVMAVGAIMIVM